MLSPAIRTFGMHRCLILGGVVALLVADSAAMLQAQDGGSSGRSGRRRSFDPASYLQRLDANGNGALEPSELSDRSRSFVEGLGFNPDETNSLEKIKAKISGDQASSGRSSGSSERSSAALGSPERNIVRKVPGFGTATPEKKSVPNFTSSGPQPSSGELDGKYGSEIMEQVNSAMGRYDKNGDGKIDQSEMSEGRWGQPDPKESDTNGDGSLSRAEMAERYYRRTRGASSSDSSSTSSSSSDRDRSEERERDSDSRSWRRSSSRSDSSRDESSRREESRESSSSSESGDSSSRSSSGSSGDRFRKYADGLMESYDEDKDGNLSKDEVGKMKQKPENADLDGNGLISAGELTEAIANGSMGGGSSGSRSGGSSSSSRERSSGSSSRSSDSSDSSESGRGSSSRSSGSRFSFLASDKNRDGNVQMHEFTDEWTDEKFEEFKTYDKNGDGVITNAEYRASDSSRRR